MAENEALLRQFRDHDWRLSLGGAPVSSQSGETFVTIDPSTGDPIAEVPQAGPADVDRAVRAGMDGFASWRHVPARERARTVREMAAILRAHSDELALLDALDSGNPVAAMRNDVEWAADCIELAADWALELKGATIPASGEHLHYTLREPFGVVARIIPFNHPLFFAAGKIAPPLVAGNAVVLKAAPQTPLSALRMAELFRDLLPRGVLSVLTASGADAGDALVRHAAVERIGFTGSESVGRKIQAAAAQSGVKVVTLELGGKNPLVAFPDADVDAVAAAAVTGMNFTATQGQSCGSTSRLIVHEAIHDEVVQAARALAEAIVVGPAVSPDTQMGPLVSQDQYEKVTRYIDIGRSEGARLVLGDGLTGVPERGWFVPPTIFDGVAPGMRIAQEEIFGPVLSVLTFTADHEALEVANGVPYGLTASIWTNDLTRAHRMARGLQAGYVWINGVSQHFWGVPFGGHKASGVGVEESVDEVLSYTRTKSVNVLLGD